MINEFYKIALQVHKERKKQELWDEYDLDNITRKEYAKFCVWSRAFNNGDFSEKSLKKYQKSEHTNFSFWLKKRMAEMFYGYEFEYNYQTKKWERKSH